MPAREQPSATDYVVIALSPLLVMLMVGALTFFLAGVLYQGKFYDRLMYTLAWFVFATVLVARVSIEEGYARASLLGVGLAAATYIALCAWIGYSDSPVSKFAPLINLFLMAVVWWSAHKLTWDCTHIDEGRKASGRGVLSAAGLGDDADNPAQEKEDAEAADAEKEEPKKRKKDEPGVLGWWARYDRHKKRQNQKPHTPGVWVVYFALAAIPLFGLGQALIPAGDAERRRAAFSQMAVYVGSALGLLVTTSLLGLRKYLRDRGAKVPAAMTMGWLGFGAGLIVLFLAVGAVLPRPHSETPLIDLKRGGKSNKKASEYAQVKDGSAGEGKGAAGEKTESGKDAKASGKSDEKGGNAGKKGDGGGKGDGKGGKQKGDGKGKQDDSSKSDAKGPNSKQDDQAKDRGKDDKGKADGGEKGGDSRDEPSRDADGKADDSSSNDSSSPQITKALESISSVVKWVVWIVLAVAVVVAVFVFFLKYLAPFTDWAKNLLDWLKGLVRKKPRVAEAGDEEAEEAPKERRPTFAEFGSPFDDGSARRMSPAELVGYTFEAFDAWAWDRDRGRQPGETPNEFAGRLGGDYPDLDTAGRAVASLYVWALYTDRELPTNAVELVRAFWVEIERPHPQPAESA